MGCVDGGFYGRAKGVFLRHIRHDRRLARGRGAGGADGAASARSRHGVDRLRRRVARPVPGRHGGNPFGPAAVRQARRRPRAQSRAHPAGLRPFRHFRRDEASARARLAQARRLAGCCARAGDPAQARARGAGVERQFLTDGGAGAAQQFPLGRDPRRGLCARLQAEAGRLSFRVRRFRSMSPGKI